MNEAVREALKERLGVEETVPGEDPLDELRARLRTIAPECRAGDRDALAERDQLAAQIAEEEQRRELDRLADEELAERERLAAAAEEERQREAWRAEKAEVDARCNDALVRFERTLKTLLESATDALEANADSWVLGQKLDLGRGVNLSMLIENRLVRCLQDELGPKYGIRPGIVIADQGRAPLAIASSSCKACEHVEREALDAALGTDESERSIAERFSVARTTLARHREHVS